jgi:hypothetical protein
VLFVAIDPLGKLGEQQPRYPIRFGDMQRIDFVTANSEGPMTTFLKDLLSGVLLVLTANVGGAFAQESRVRPYEVTEERTPCRDFAPARRPFFGDTHVHTTLSFDANSQDTRNRPRDAYEFAKGRRMGIQPYDGEGNALRSIRLDRPLDFTALTDHAEFLGEMNLCNAKGTWTYWHPLCLAHRNLPIAGIIAFGYRGLIRKTRWGICGDDGEKCAAALRAPWTEIQEAAEGAYDRSAACSFTSFVGYEWTASTGEGINLHRNVIFRNDKVPDVPASWIDTPSATDLWNALEEKCVRGKPGCDALTIPHNSNLSAGLIFETADVKGETASHPIRADEANRRSRWEPLVEVMQHKGSSECDARLPEWSNDEACAFEKLPYDRFGGKGGYMRSEVRPPTAANYIRWSLAQGLRQLETLGANGFKFGLIASTDTHIAAPGLTAEKKHPGHGGAGKAAGGGDLDLREFPDDFEFGPGGLAVLWAEENTRDALFAAMQRREAYGTSGTRPVVRFFGGWDYPEDLCGSPEFADEGYANGVPMGGDLPARPAAGSAPRFAVWALKDPGTADEPGRPLQRIQIVKGWTQDGELHERVIEVAGGDNGASVDLATCEPHGEGAATLCTVWSDPEFDTAAPAFYYARVLENPTCRWSQYVCLDAKVDCEDLESVPEGLQMCCSDGHRRVIQERAWTSPIWYTP